MKNLFRILIVASAGLVLSACAGQQLQHAKKATPGGTAFDKGLYAGYLKLSEGEYKEGDYVDSDAFANRAITAAGGQKVAPEALKARDLPSNKVGEMTNARKWLVSGLNKGAGTKAPKAAAAAQTGFDCWMQEQEENFQPKDIAACRKAFLAAMGKVESALEQPKMMKKKATMMRPEKPTVDGIYVLFFDYNSTSINSQAQETLRKAIFDYHLTKPDSIYLSGHADTSGSAEYNIHLSERRLEAVMKSMGNSQVPDTVLETEAFGESKPLVLSGDGKKEPKNRRVEIIFE